MVHLNRTVLRDGFIKSFSYGSKTDEMFSFIIMFISSL